MPVLKPLLQPDRLVFDSAAKATNVGKFTVHMRRQPYRMKYRKNVLFTSELPNDNAANSS